MNFRCIHITYKPVNIQSLKKDMFVSWCYCVCEGILIVFIPSTKSHQSFLICVVSGMALLSETVGLDRVGKEQESRETHLHRMLQCGLSLSSYDFHLSHF